MPTAGKNEILSAIYPRCWICRLPFAEHPHLQRTKDHYLPKSKGGGNELDNLRYAHLFCNNRRADRLGNPSKGFRMHCRQHIQKVLKRLAAKTYFEEILDQTAVAPTNQKCSSLR